MRGRTIGVVVSCGVAAAPSLAQWSNDPAVNQAVAIGAGDQVLPKTAATADGGLYVSWFDSLAAGFDVRLQRLDADGVAQWDAAGVLVADRSFSSTQDYDLAVDADGNAILVFRDDRSGSVQITAAKVAADGSQPWGITGVQLTSGSAFFAAPKVAVTTNGFVVAAWTQDADAALQRLDEVGTPQWMTSAIVSDDGGQNFSPSDLVPSEAGSVVMAIVRYGSFSDPRQLYAQRIDADGAEVWAAPVAVFDGGSLQFGNFPTIVSDGAGGAVFGWYSSSPSLQCYAQRLLADGTEVFPHDGVPGSTNATRLRVSPAVGYDTRTGSTLLFWTETNQTQSQDGLYGQRFSADGVRQWTDDGLAVVPVGAHDIAFVVVQPSCGGATVGWIDAQGIGDDRVHAARLDGGGVLRWPGGIVDVSTAVSDKLRLTATTVGPGGTIFAWQDDRNDEGDAFLQRLNADGTPGPNACPADTNGDGSVDVDDLINVVLDWATNGCEHGGDVDGSGTVDVDDLVTVIVAWGRCG